MKNGVVERRMKEERERSSPTTSPLAVALRGCG